MKQQMISNPMMSSSFPPSNITTDQIQKFLDENKQLILAIMNNQNLGKLAECAQYQALLQKNLMYLAAIADAQPPTPTISSQTTPLPHPGMQQPGAFYMQPQQPSGFMPQMQFNNNNNNNNSSRSGGPPASSAPTGGASAKDGQGGQAEEAK